MSTLYRVIAVSTKGVPSLAIVPPIRVNGALPATASYYGWSGAAFVQITYEEAVREHQRHRSSSGRLPEDPFHLEGLNRYASEKERNR